MKAIRIILAVTMMAGLAMAQAAATKKPKAPASQAVSDQATPAPGQAATSTPKKKSTPKAAAAPAAAKAPEKPGAAAAAPPAAEAKKPAGKRDPFVSPVVRASGGGPVCGSGKRCLAIGEMLLVGIVKTPGGMIAVVENQAKRTYFLHENDPVFNGAVVRITSDSVVFRENVLDNLGRETTREVVKRVSAPPV